MRVTAELGLKDQIQKDIYIAKGASPKEVVLNPKLLINAGSVGEPRHGGIEATYVIFNTNSKDVQIREVPYDVNQTISALKKSGLPEVFAERLLRGKEFAEKSKDIVCVC